MTDRDNEKQRHPKAAPNHVCGVAANAICGFAADARALRARKGPPGPKGPLGPEGKDRSKYEHHAQLKQLSPSCSRSVQRPPCTRAGSISRARVGAPSVCIMSRQRAFPGSDEVEGPIAVVSDAIESGTITSAQAAMIFSDTQCRVSVTLVC